MPISRCIAAVMALALAGAQTPRSASPGSDTVIRINVNLVQTDAIVTDAKDKPVTDLRKEDFVVLQDGKAQVITNFSYISTKAPALRTAAAKSTGAGKGTPSAPLPRPGALRPEQVRRTIALVVDDLGLSFESISHIRQSLKKWVDDDMQQGDLVAVIRTSAGMGALQQFTNDKRILYAAIERVRYNSMGRVGTAAFPQFEGDPGIHINATGADEERERMFAVGSMGAIQYVVQGLREVPGRKTAVLFSENLRLMFSDGRSQQVVEQLQRLTDAANRSSVVIYSIDPRGLVYTGLTAADDVHGRTAAQIGEIPRARSQQLFDSQEGMVLLAHNTGGLFVQNNNDIGGSLKKVVEDGEGYYLIGYHPDASTFDQKTGRPKFHNLQVRVKRAGLKVRSRKGFIGTSDRQEAPVAHTRQAEISHALFSPFSTGALHLRLTTIFTQTTKDGPYINALLHFDPKELRFTDEPDDWHKAVVDTVAITFGADGEEVGATDKQWTIRARGKTYEDMLRKGIVYSLHVPVKKPGAYQMRAVLRDATSEDVGSATQFVEVPDVSKGHLTLSGIVLVAEKSLAPPKPAGAEGVGHEEGQVVDDDPNGTAAVRIFKAGAAIAYGYQILNAQTGEDKKPQLEVQTRLFRDGEPVYTGKPVAMQTDAPSDPKRMVGGGRLQLGRAAPGDYVLQIVVTDKLVKDKYRYAAQSMDFQIQ